jgi:2-keto-4-pentenoate hydratase/2-oxohepta-3-ene-1,7-dioic acid hydratase in catechol pathway
VRYARFRHDGTVRYGVVDGDRVTPISGPPYEEHVTTGRSVALGEVALLAPVVPSKLIAIALNYPSHLGDVDAPGRPEAFLKAPTCLTDPGAPVVLPAGSGRVDAEGELVAVIGLACKRVASTDALSYVFGYTCGNDVSARVWQRGDKQWFRGKSSDTFAPLGPFVVTDLDPADLELRTRIDGREVQAANTKEMLFDLAEIISSVSQVMTLLPGDVIFTGTPGVPGELTAGCTVEVEIDGIGTLTNPVEAEAP